MKASVHIFKLKAKPDFWGTYLKCLVLRLQVLAQLQTQQAGGALPQHIKLQLPIQIQQTGASSTQGGQVKHLTIDFIVNVYDPANLTELEKQKCSNLMIQYH